MFSIFKRWFANDLLVELSETQLKIQSFTHNREFDEPPLIAFKEFKGSLVVEAIGDQAKLLNSNEFKVSNPFKHPRSFIGDFLQAEKLLQMAFRKIHSDTGMLVPSPRVIVHQLEKTEGGLSQLEVRALRELILGAGGREVLVYTGQRINPKVVTYDELKYQADHS